MKSHLLTFACGLAGIGLIVALLALGSEAIKGRESAATPDFVLETPDIADLDGSANDLAAPDEADALPFEEPAAVRNIDPEKFALPDGVTTAPLERIEPRLPLSKPVTPEPVTTVLRHPVAVSAGLIRFGESLLQLDGLDPQDPGRVCDLKGKAWPCGMAARTAFRNFLRARALVCSVPRGGWNGTVTSACTVGKTDPAVWLAENGWATVPAGSPLSEKVKAAETAGIGFFGPDPRVVVPDVPPQADPVDAVADQDVLPDL